MHVAATAGVAIAVSFATAIATGATVGRATAVLLCAVSSDLGSAVAAAWLAPRVVVALVAPNAVPGLLARHAACAALPVIASGALRPFLSPHAGLRLTLCACILTWASSYWGAESFLGLCGRTRLSTAAIAAALASAPPLGLAYLCLD
jgi:hypothetical protein